MANIRADTLTCLYVMLWHDVYRGDVMSNRFGNYTFVVIVKTSSDLVKCRQVDIRLHVNSASLLPATATLWYIRMKELKFYQ